MSQRDYTKEMDWYPNDSPTLVIWQIKTIAHRWQQLGYFFIFVMVACAASTAIILCVNRYTDWMTPLLPLIGLFVFGYFFILEIRHKTWLVFKFYKEGVEAFYWKAYPEWLFAIIAILFGVACIGALVLGAVTGQWLLALTGPVGIAFVMGGVAMSKGYKEMMHNRKHRASNWEYLEEAQYDAKRNVICLFFNMPLTEQRKQRLRSEGYTEERMKRILTAWSLYVFPTPELTEQVVSLVENSLKAGVTLERKPIRLPEVL